MPQVTYLDTVLELTSLDSVRFSWAGGDYRARPALGPDLAERLLELELDPDAYGRELYEAIVPAHSELREGLREATCAAQRERSRLRLRLHLAPGLPEWIPALYWELLTDPERQLALSRSPDTAFSRYLEVRQEQGTPAGHRPRLLCVVSAPSDLARFGMATICREEVMRRLEDSFAALSDSVEVVVLDPPVTLERLRARLMETADFQLLHFFGHGERRRDGSALVLEDNGGRADFVEERLLAELFLGLHELRLITLIACHGGAPSSTDPFSGLAGRLVQRGLPAVIAMRREVSVESAHIFTEHLYRHMAQTGRADAAANEARHQLYLAQPHGIDWSSPMLYSRLSDGRLWFSENEEGVSREPAENQGPLHRASRLYPLQLLVLAAVLAVISAFAAWPPTPSEARFSLFVSQMTVWVLRSVAVVERLDLRDLIARHLPVSASPPSSDASASGEKDSPVANVPFSLPMSDVPRTPRGVEGKAGRVLKTTSSRSSIQSKLAPSKIAAPKSGYFGSGTRIGGSVVNPASAREVGGRQLTEAQINNSCLVADSPVALPRERGVYKLGLIVSGAHERERLDALGAVQLAFFYSRRFRVVQCMTVEGALTDQDLKNFTLRQGKHELGSGSAPDLLGIVDYSVESVLFAGKEIAAWALTVRLVDVETFDLMTTLTSQRRGPSLSPSTLWVAEDLLRQSIREAFPPFGRILKVATDEYVIDLGFVDGLRVGDILEIVEDESIIDPFTGSATWGAVKVIGELAVVSISPRSSSCKLKSARGEVHPELVMLMTPSQPRLSISTPAEGRAEPTTTPLSEPSGSEDEV